MSAKHEQAGRLGAHTRWAKELDRSAATQPAREGLLRRFENEVDPDRTLPVLERARRAESARKAFYQRIAMKSAKARAEKTAAKQAARKELRREARPDDGA